MRFVCLYPSHLETSYFPKSSSTCFVAFNFHLHSPLVSTYRYLSHSSCHPPCLARLRSCDCCVEDLVQTVARPETKNKKKRDQTWLRMWVIVSGEVTRQNHDRSGTRNITATARFEATLERRIIPKTPCNFSGFP